MVALPTLSPQQRAAALEKAAHVRRARAEIKEKLKNGSVTLSDLLTQAETDDVVGKMRVASVLEALPGIGKVRAASTMEKLKIADTRRLRGLGENQKRALVDEF